MTSEQMLKSIMENAHLNTFDMKNDIFDFTTSSNSGSYCKILFQTDKYMCLTVLGKVRLLPRCR